MEVRGRSRRSSKTTPGNDRVFNAGKPHQKLENLDGITGALAEAGVSLIFPLDLAERDDGANQSHYGRGNVIHCELLCGPTLSFQKKNLRGGPAES